MKKESPSLDLDQIIEIENHRKKWMLLGAFIFSFALWIIVGWENLKEKDFIWILVSLGLIVGIAWWYWTMNVIKKLLNYRSEEALILKELQIEIKEMRQDLQKKLPIDLTQ